MSWLGLSHPSDPHSTGLSRNANLSTSLETRHGSQGEIQVQYPAFKGHTTGPHHVHLLTWRQCWSRGQGLGASLALMASDTFTFCILFLSYLSKMR